MKGIKKNQISTQMWARKSSAFGNTYLFTGRRLEEKSGIYYYRNRYHESRSGRFVSRDPQGYADGMSLYVYVENNSLNAKDPLGLYKVSLVFINNRLNLPTHIVGWLRSGDYNFNNPTQILNQIQKSVRSPIDRSKGTCKDCLKNLELIDHGGKGSFSLGEAGGAQYNEQLGLLYTDHLPQKGYVGPTEKLIKSLRQYMCVDGEIFINMCNAGQGTSGDKLLQELANITGVKVTAPTGLCQKVLTRPENVKSKKPAPGKSIADDEKRIKPLLKSKMAKNTPK